MANELQYYGDPDKDSGLTIIARVYDAAGVQAGTDITCTEVGTLAIYMGDMPAAPAGMYAVRFHDGTRQIGQGCISWDGTAEITALTKDAKLDLLETQAGADARQVLLIAEHDATQSDIAALASTSLTAADVAAELTTYDAATQADLDASEATVLAAITAGSNGLTAADVYAEFTSGANADAFKADVSLLATTADISALNNITAADVWAATTRTLTDTSGFSLSPGEYASIATAVEQSILDDGDGQAVLNAIVGAIGNMNVDEIALVAAIRADLERTGGSIDLIETRAEADARQVLLIAEHDSTQSTVTSGAGVDPTIIAAAVWDRDMGLHTAAGSAGETQPHQDTSALAGGVANALNSLGSLDVNVVQVTGTNVSNIFDFHVDISGLETKGQADLRQSDLLEEHNNTQVSINSLNNLSSSSLDLALANYGGATSAELTTAQGAIITALPAEHTPNDIYTFFTNGSNEDIFKADIATALSSYDGATRADLSSLETNILSGQSASTLTAPQVYAEFTSGANADVFKADLTGLATASDVQSSENNILSGQAGITATVDYNLIADAVWDEDMTAHNSANSAGSTQPYRDSITLANDIQSRINANGGITADIVKVAGSNVSNIFDFHTDISGLETKGQADARQASLLSEHSDTHVFINNLENVSLADIVAAVVSYDAATGSELAAVQNAILAAIPGTGFSPADVYAYFTQGSNENAFKADLTGIATTANVNSTQNSLTTQNGVIQASVAALNNLSPADVQMVLDTYDAATPADLANTEANILAGINSNSITAPAIYAEFTSGSNADAFKADLSGVASSAELATLEANIIADNAAQSAVILAALSTLPADVWNNQPWEMLDQTTFVNGVLTSARVRHFPDQAAALAATDGGTGEGEITTYLVTSTPNGNVGEILTYRKLKQ